jgi:hypothetical protein
LTTYQCHKRDHACIWFSHLPVDVTQQLELLLPNEPAQLAVNCEPTTWRRMKPGAGRPTRGIRIETGKETWDSIPLGGSFSLELLERGSAIVGAATALHPQMTAFVRPATGTTLFDAYLFIDYSGASSVQAQRKSIRTAYGEGQCPATIVPGGFSRGFSREDAAAFTLDCLRQATRRGIRVCFGQDHAYGIPFGLASDLGLDQQPWRSALRAFLNGSYAGDAPAFVNVPTFAADFNRWLIKHGQQPYFWSATKAAEYDVPSHNPRRDDSHGSVYRLTDRCQGRSGRGNPKPIGRLGDPGTVGNQSLYGMQRLLELDAACQEEGIKLRFWPFDGLDVMAAEYEEAHVAVEPNPTALRPRDVQQSDANDALHSALSVQEADMSGQGLQLFDLTGLGSAGAARVRFEGWILGGLPPTV